MVALQNIAGLVLFLAQSVTVQSMDLDSRQGVLKASKALAGDLIEFYNGNKSGNIPGLLEESDTLGNGYYWYQSGAFMSAFVDYWQLTGDDTYNDLITEGIQWQIGRDKDFMPANQTRQEGNDDQAIWAMAAMTAAEYGFPTSADKKAQWYDLAKNAWDTQRKRWDTEYDTEVCYGGLRWQIMPTNAGFEYKSSKLTGSLAVSGFITDVHSFVDCAVLQPWRTYLPMDWK
jgi:mannan endo-1,6-alpha-mannosidase